MEEQTITTASVVVTEPTTNVESNTTSTTVIEETKPTSTTDAAVVTETTATTTETKNEEKVDKNRGLEAKIKPEFVLPYRKVEKPEPVDKSAKKKEFRNQLKESMNDKLCPKLIKDLVCDFGDKCKFIHNVEQYLANKTKSPGICPNFQNYGECKYGLSCVFGDCHIVDNKNVINQELVNKATTNIITNEVSNQIQNLLKHKEYPFPKSQIYFKENGITEKQPGKNNNNRNNNNNNNNNKRKEQTTPTTTAPTTTTTTTVEPTTTTTTTTEEDNQPNKKIKVEGDQSIGITTPTPTTTTTTTEVVTSETTTKESTTTTTTNYVQSNEHTEIDKILPLKPNEKKRINFKNQLILAPLTTVGNLPFRRICKRLGADITIGEMALTTKLLEGHKSELALLKRHSSEDVFGVQICGSYVDSAVKCAEFIENEIEADFVDINSGCPIDLICNMGAGSALMERPKKMEQLLRGISSQLTCPTTIKIRVGKLEDNPNAHKIIPSLGEWGAQAVTLHGRSRTQRYSRLANWDYVKQCSELSPIPLIGNGDIYNYQDVVNIYDTSKVSSIMIARGALIKPWIFTEIKEKRNWDISASERLEFVRDFTNYGLDHWGSDKIGVDNTRKFLLNWLSFTHRYIPLGILEGLHYMNERPPAYFGRSDLETLLSSPNIKDWIKITEMFLGPVASDYSFVPKHNSNSFTNVEG